MTAAGPNMSRPDQAAQCHPQTDALDPPTTPTMDQERQAAAARVRQGTAADHAGALELFKSPPEGGELLSTISSDINAAQVIHGDCLEELVKLEAGSVQLMFCDPPYNLGIDYGDGAKADKLPDSEYLDWCARWIEACAHVLHEHGSMWMLISEEWTDHYGIMLRDAGLHRRRLIVWYETFGQNCRCNFNRTARFLHYCVKDPKRFTFNTEAVNRPSDRQAKYNDKRANPAGKNWDSVWKIPRLTGTCKERIPGFPTQLPLALLRPFVGSTSNPGDLVVDPFSGSATTGVAAIESGRRYVGIEKNETYLQMSCERLQASDARFDTR